MRIQTFCDKSVRRVPILPIVVPAATPNANPPAGTTDVLADNTNDKSEYAQRMIQNVGANPCYYNFGADCDATNNFCGILSPLQQLDCSIDLERVSVYSVLGTTIAITLLRRVDLFQHLQIRNQLIQT
jgi:hypothetical protein